MTDSASPRDARLLRAECLARRESARLEYAAAMGDTRISADEKVVYWEAEANFFSQLAAALSVAAGSPSPEPSVTSALDQAIAMLREVSAFLKGLKRPRGAASQDTEGKRE